METLTRLGMMAREQSPIARCLAKPERAGQLSCECVSSHCSAWRVDEACLMLPERELAARALVPKEKGWDPLHLLLGRSGM